MCNLCDKHEVPTLHVSILFDPDAELVVETMCAAVQHGTDVVGCTGLDVDRFAFQFETLL